MIAVRPTTTQDVDQSRHSLKRPASISHRSDRTLNFKVRKISREGINKFLQKHCESNHKKSVSFLMQDKEQNSNDYKHNNQQETSEDAGHHSSKSQLHSKGSGNTGFHDFMQDIRNNLENQSSQQKQSSINPILKKSHNSFDQDLHASKIQKNYIKLQQAEEAADKLMNANQDSIDFMQEIKKHQQSILLRQRKYQAPDDQSIAHKIRLQIHSSSNRVQTSVSQVKRSYQEKFIGGELKNLSTSRLSQEYPKLIKPKNHDLAPLIFTNRQSKEERSKSSISIHQSQRFNQKKQQIDNIIRSTELEPRVLTQRKPPKFIPNIESSANQLVKSEKVYKSQVFLKDQLYQQGNDLENDQSFISSIKKNLKFTDDLNRIQDKAELREKLQQFLDNPGLLDFISQSKKKRHKRRLKLKNSSEKISRRNSKVGQSRMKLLQNDTESYVQVNLAKKNAMSCSKKNKYKSFIFDIYSLPDDVREQMMKKYINTPVFGKATKVKNND